MSKQQLATRVATITPTAEIPEKRFVGFDEAIAGDGGGTGVAVLGVTDTKIEANTAGRIVLGETAMVTSGAALDGSEVRVKTDAQGRAIAWTNGSIVAGRLVKGQTATDAGQIVEVWLVGNN